MNCLFTTRSQYFGHEEQFIFVKFYAEDLLGIIDYFLCVKYNTFCKILYRPSKNKNSYLLMIFLDHILANYYNYGLKNKTGDYLKI